MKLNNLSRLTALLLALTMILPVFAAAEDTYTTFENLTGEVLTTYDSVTAFTEAGYCATCAEEVVYAGYTTWPVENNKCLYAHLSAMSSGKAYDYFNAVYETDYALSQLFVETNQAHVDLNAESALCVQTSGGCIQAGVYTAPGPSHIEGTCPWWQETEYVPMAEQTLTSGAVTVSGKMPADVQLVVSAATVDTSIMDLSYFDSYETFGYNIALYRPGEDATIGTTDDIKWQPKDSGETVTVTIAKAYSVDNYPAVDVYHVKDDTTMELLTSRNGSVALTEDGTSFSFTVDEFSTFHCAAGLWSLNLSDMSGSSHTINVIAGLETTLQLIVRDTSATISPATVESGFVAPTSTTITDDEKNTATMFTIGTTTASKAGTSQTYTVKWDNEEVEVTLNVVTKENWSITYPGTKVDHIQINLTFDAVITDDDGNTTTATVKIPTPTTTNGNYNYAPTATTSSTTSFTTYAEDQTVTTTVNGTSQSLTTDTAVKIEIVDPTSYGYSYPSSQSFSVSSITNKESQLSFNGSFPIGVFGAPVIYRVTIDTTIKIPVKDANGNIVLDSEGNITYKEQQVSLSKLIYYWHPDNICPGAKGTYDTGVTPGNSSGNHGGGGNAGGIDIGEFGASIDGTGSLALTKTLAEKLNVEKTFKIYVYKYQENTTESTDDDWVKMDQFTVEITVPAGDTTATKTIVDIPYGTYKIVEDTVDTDSYKPNIDGYTLTVEYTTTYSDGTVEKNNVYTFSKEARIWQANVKNTYTAKTGNLVISKTVNDGAPAGDVFTFKVTLSDTSINGTYGDATFTNGVATLTLTGGQTATITGIPAGTTYTVTEAAVAGYTNTAKSGDTGTIPAGSSATASFTNTYSVGNLSITKKVVDGTETNGTNSDSFAFTVTLSAPEDIVLAENYAVTGVTGAEYNKANGTITFSLSNDQTAVITGIQVGVGYQVVETVDATKYTTEVDDVVNTATSGTIAASGNAHVFTNTYTKGDLMITKTVSDAGESSTQKFEFTLTGIPGGTFEIAGATDQDGNALSTIANGGKFYLTGGGSATIKDLPDDTVCTVKETPVAGYATTADGTEGLTASKTIVAGGVVEIHFINAYSVADLTITKTVVTETNVTAPADEFKITVNLTAGANAVLASKYDFTKTDVNGTFSTGELTVSEGKVSFALKHGETIVIHDLQLDTKYTVTEAETPHYTGTVAPSGQQTLETDTTVTVTNTYNTGNLTVAKKVEGTYAPAGEKFSFTLTLKDGNTAVTPPLTVNGTAITWTNNVYTFEVGYNERITIYGIPDGVTYTVTEVQPEGFAYTTKVNGVDDYTTSGTANDNPTVTFTNTYKYSQLTITKTIVDAPEGIAGQSFNITVTLPNNTGNYTYTNSNGTSGKVPSDGKLTIKKGEVITIGKLPIDGGFSVVEDEISYFTPGYVYTPVQSDKKIVDAGNNVVITNTYKSGSLTITKTVVGVTAPDQEFTFTVDIDGMTLADNFAYTVATANVEGTTSGEIADGGQLTLKNGQTATISGLPVGVNCTVTEQAIDGNPYTTEVKVNDGDSTTASAATVAIPESGAGAVEFTNTYQYSDLKISKKVVNGTRFTPAVNAFVFTVQLIGASVPDQVTYIINETSYTATVDNAGQFNLTLTNNQTATIKNLPADTTYTVTEAEVPGYTTTITKNSETVDEAIGAIVAGAQTVDEVVFTNEYKVGSLEVTKEVVGGDAPVGEEFSFTLTLEGLSAYPADATCAIGDKTETISWENGSYNFQLQDGETAKFNGLPDGVTYKVEETVHSDYTPSATPTASIANGIATVDGTISATTPSEVKFTNTYKYSHLTIEKTGMKSNAESAIFTVSNGEKTFTVVVPNEDSVTIGKLLIGDTYTVAESGSWTWLYTPSISPASIQIKEGGNTVIVTNSGTDKWLHDESGVINTYGIFGGTSID